MTTIHWVGTGLSSLPGLKKLITDGHNVVVWNRTVATAQAALAGLNADIRAFDIDALGNALEKGDLAVSMLPGDWHVYRQQCALCVVLIYLTRNARFTFYRTGNGVVFC
jgi:3-hydroxyisobutyrate dehydrogenase-like beta-hydroxyacid dehydrogenase